MSTYEIGSIVFDKWKICRELGQGSYGTVYEIQREDFGGVYKAALKVITVPQSRTELQSVLDEGMTPPQAKQYFYSVVEDIGRECAIMSRLKGTGNIVSYEDHAVLPAPRRHRLGHSHPHGAAAPAAAVCLPAPDGAAGHHQARHRYLQGRWSFASGTISSTATSSRKTFLFPTTETTSSAISASRGRSNARPPACPRRARIVTWPRRSTLERNMASASTRIRSDWCCTGC